MFQILVENVGMCVLFYFHFYRAHFFGVFRQYFRESKVFFSVFDEKGVLGPFSEKQLMILSLNQHGFKRFSGNYIVGPKIGLLYVVFF